MGHKMLLPGRRLESLVYSLNVIGFLLIALPLVAISQADSRELDWKRSEKRVNQIVASELLRPSILTTPIGQLTKTTRTFVQDGASTEYVTEILGSTFDGRGYAQILSTSSRIFYEKDNSLPEQTSPYLVYPSASLVQNKWKLDDGISAAKPSDVILSTPSLNNQIDQLKNQENDIFEEKLEFNNDLDKKFQPSRPLVNLPTYTVKHDTVKLSNSDFDFEKDIIHDEDVKSYRVKTPKMLNSEVIQDTPKNEPLKSLETITYYGFADFMTTVGRTVIVFSPSTSSSSMERIATTIAGDATLRSADGGGVMPFTSSIQATRAYPKSTSVIVLDEINPTITLKTIESTSSINIIDDQENMYSTTPGDMDDSQMLFNLSDDNDSSNTESPSYEQKDIKDDSSKTSVVQSVSRKVTSSSNNPETTTMDENLTSFDDEQKFTVQTSKNSSSTTLTTVSPLNSEDINDIVNLSGRKLNGCKSKNLFGNNGKELSNDCTTILSPSSTQRVFTDSTTIFIDDIISEDNITTSIEPSKTIDTSSSTYQTQETSDINLPQKSQTLLLSTIDLPVEIINSTDSVYDEIPVTKREEYELIFKTLYTTYTYLTTFFQDSTSNVSSREVIETNVVTQTVQSGDSTDEIISITPTKPLDMELRKTSTQSPLLNEDDYEEFTTDNVMASKSIVTDPTPSTIQTKYLEEAPIEGSFDESINLEPSPMLVDGVDGFETKTYFTTYTYFTTVFVDDEIEIDTRTEVFSNIVTEPMKTTTKMEIITTKINDMPTTPADMKPKEQAAVPLEILAYLEALKNKKLQEEKLVTPTKEITPSQNATVSSSQTETSQKMIVTATTNSTDKETLKSIISGISSTSTSSDGPRFVSYADKDVEVNQDDQELSESNHHDVEPVPTVILRTSYTTFTYFTTMYKGEDTNVVSRLETVTKVMTETVGPTMAIESPVALETSSLPVTYFTTFTYWTTYYHAGSTVTTSREETVSNLVTPGVSPTPRVQLGVIQTYRPDLPTMTLDGIEKVRKEETDNEVMRQDRESLNNSPVIQTSILTPSMIEDKAPSSSDSEVTSTVNIEPTTYYTTFTYFTTSYLGNQTILNSRHETITNVALGDISKATGRAINLPASGIQNLQFEDKIRNAEIKPTKTVDESKIGILSTIRSSKISDETTTHFLTDVYGTYIDGLYAQLVRSSISLEGPKPSQTTTAINSGSSDILNKTVFLNEGTIIDADEVTTIYFTTSQFVKPVDNTYTTLIESTSSTKIDLEKNKTLTSSKEAGHKTGLVRLIKGQIKTNGETLLYQSKVIGTSIDGRYAQIIESTTSYLISPTSISPSVTETQYSTTGILSPSPEVLQGSKPSNKENEPVDESDDEGQKDDEGNSDNEEEDDNDTSKKKSRLTFSSRKRTFTPIIRPFLSRNRPNFNPLKRKNAQGATTITRSDITPTITATLAASKNRGFLSSRGRPVSSLSSSSSSAASISPSRRFSGRKSFSSSSSTPTFTSSVRGRASGRISSSPTFGGDRRLGSTIKGSFAKPLNRGSSSLYVGGGSSRYRGPIRSTSVEQSKLTPSSTRSYQSAKYDSDQDNDANEPFMTTLSSIENLNNNSDDLKSEIKEITETIPVELPKKKNTLVKSRISPNRSPKSSPLPSTSSRKNIWSQTTTVASLINNGSINYHLQNVPHGFRKENDNNRFSYESTSFPNLSEADEFLDNTEARSKINSQIERINYNQDNQNTETVNNDYEGSSSTTDELKKVDNTYQDNQAFKRPNNPRLSNRFVVKRRRIRRQANQLRSYQSNRYRKLGSLSTSTESGIDSSNTGSNDVLATKSSSLQNNGKNRIVSSALPRNNEKHYSETSELRTRSKIRPATNQRVQPSSKSNGRQFTLREKSTTVPPTSYNSKQENFRRPTKSRGRLSTKRTTEATFEPSRKGTSRTSSMRTRNTSRRTSQKGLSRSRDDISANKENEKITVTHYIPTEATIPILNNGETEYRNIITGSPSVEVLNPNGYSTIIGVDGKESLIIATESSGINQNGQTEFTQFVLHSTPTSRVSHTLVTLGGRRVSQSLIVPSTIYSVENVISTLPAEKMNAESQAPLANLLLSQLLLNQFGQFNKGNLLLGASETKIAEAIPTTSYNTRTTTYVTTLTKEQSTVIPLTFRGKEILTTLIDHSTEVVTATEFLTDTVVITPTSTLPAANLDSLLYLLNQSPQGLQQPIKSPLVLMTPTIIQSEIFANEGERQYQSLNLYDEQVLEPSAKEQPAEQSVITVYVSGKRPGEFRTVLSTVKLNDAMNTRSKRNTLAPVEPSIILQTLEQPEATSTKLSPSEELPNTHIPTQSLESIVGDVGRHIFGSTDI